MEGGWWPGGGPETPIQEATAGRAGLRVWRRAPSGAHQAAGARWRWRRLGGAWGGTDSPRPASRALQINSLN